MVIEPGQSYESVKRRLEYQHKMRVKQVEVTALTILVLIDVIAITSAIIDYYGG